MCRLMRLGMILALIESGALLGMEVNDSDSQLMVLPVEKRFDIYEKMTIDELNCFSIVSRDIYSEIYDFKNTKAGIPKLNKEFKRYNDLCVEYMRQGDSRMSLKMNDIATRCYFRPMLESKRDMKIIKQPWMWMIENEEKEDSQ
jgi:hypothetical protein